MSRVFPRSLLMSYKIPIKPNSSLQKKAYTIVYISVSLFISQAERDLCMLSPLETIVAGSISGFAGVIICHPIDSIRTHLQATKSQSTSQVIKSVLQAHGVKGFYKGFAPPFLVQGVYKSIIFTVNNYVHRKTNHTFISGLVAGTVNALVVSPVELVRTKQILSSISNSSSLSLMQILKDIINSNGPRALWSTLLPTIIRDGPGVGFYFISFNYFKKYFSSLIPANGDNIWIKIVAGIGAGISFWMWVSAFHTNFLQTFINYMTIYAFI